MLHLFKLQWTNLEWKQSKINYLTTAANLEKIQPNFENSYIKDR